MKPVVVLFVCVMPVGLAFAAQEDRAMRDEARRIVSRHKAVFTQPPRRIPSRAQTDAPGRGGLTAFGFSQTVVERWRGSKFGVRREIVECVTSNRTLSDVSLVLTKRKPFDILAERPSLRLGRGDWI